MSNVDYIQQSYNELRDNWATELFKLANRLNDGNIEEITQELMDLAKNIQSKPRCQTSTVTEGLVLVALLLLFF